MHRYIISYLANGYGPDKFVDFTKKKAIQNTKGLVFCENGQYNNPKQDG